MQILQQIITALTAIVMTLSSQVANLNQTIDPSTQLAQVVSAPTNGLVGYWNFDEGAGITIIDSSGGGNSGTLTNGPIWVVGKIGVGSLSFDGVDDYVSINDSNGISSIEGSNEATISFWVKRNNTVSNGLISRWGNGRLFAIQGDSFFPLRPYWRYGGSGSGGTSIDHSCASTQCSLPVGEWHHVVTMYNNPTSYIYIDGVLKSSKEGSGGALNTDISDPLKIGSYLSNYTNASIDDVRIYNRALSAQEIQDIYTAGGGSTVSTPTPTPTPTPTQTPNPTSPTTSTPSSSNGIYSVKQDGTGSFVTIQTCANTVKAGETCLVYPGTYNEHVTTVNGGTSENNRVIFKTQGFVTMKGFDIKHPYVTIDGFDMTNYGTKWGFHINVIGNASYCKLLNNTIRDDTLSGAIKFSNNAGVKPSYCEVKNNVIKNLGYIFLSMDGGNHLVENNILSRLNSRDFIYVFGHDHVFRRNTFLDGNTIADAGNHPDWVQTFGNYDAESYNMLFEENWIQDLDAQLSQLNSQTDLDYSVPAQLSTKIYNWTFKRNVFVNTTSNMNISIPGVTFANNTFYKTFTQQSGISFGGSLKRGDSSRTLLKNNVFVGGGKTPDPYGYSGYYSRGRALLSKEVLYPLSPDLNIGSGIFNDLVKNGYIDSNGNLSDKTRSLTDISQFTLDNSYSSYKSGVYDLIIRTIQLDDSIKNTFSADYNFVAESSPGFAPKSVSCLDPRRMYTNFCESNGINGGNPLFKNINNPLGVDGLPFTSDDGLAPLAGSPLCGNGENGSDIGAYACPNGQINDINNNQIDSSAPSVPSGLVASVISSTQINLSWLASTDNVAVAGYRIYRNGSQIGVSISSSFIDSGLIPATNYSYKVVAYDNSGNVSSQSTSVSVTTKSVLPVISNLVSSDSTSNSIKISWNTNIPTNGKVFYGLTTSYGSQSQLIDDATKTTSHSVIITSLLPNTTYNFKVTSTDAQNNIVSSSNFTFTTSALQNITSSDTPPVNGVGGGGAPSSSSVVASSGGATIVHIPPLPTSLVNNNLSEDEKIKQLQAVIASLFKQIEELQAQLQIKISGARGQYTFTRNLYLGTRGDDVKQLQQLLISKGYLPSTLVPTTFFGQMTKSALQKYQCQQGLVCSGTESTTGYGVFGAKTRASIMK